MTQTTTTTQKLLTPDEALAAMDAIMGEPLVKVELLPDGYYWLTWSTKDFDKTRRVHPWNLDAELAEAEAEADRFPGTGVTTMTTALADLQGPKGPFLLEVLMTNPRDSSERRWVLQQSVRTLEEGLAVASRMCSSYQFRLFLGAEWGYLSLVWEDDPTDPDLCIPVWKR